MLCQAPPKNRESPAQIIAVSRVFMDDDTVMVMVEESEQDPVEPTTWYVVVDVGVATGLGQDVQLNPEEGDHE